MPKPKTFETQYPTIHHFVEDTGWIEIGQNNMISALVRAYDQGGTVSKAKTLTPAWKPRSKT
jgi:hypothetical protein